MFLLPSAQSLAIPGEDSRVETSSQSLVRATQRWSQHMRMQVAPSRRTDSSSYSCIATGDFFPNGQVRVSELDYS
jgi:hypothetical protein